MFYVFGNDEFGITFLCTVFVKHILRFKSKRKTKITDLQKSVTKQLPLRKETSPRTPKLTHKKSAIQKPSQMTETSLSLGYVSGSINFKELGNEENTTEVLL